MGVSWREEKGVDTGKVPCANTGVFRYLLTISNNACDEHRFPGFHPGILAFTGNVNGLFWPESVPTQAVSSSGEA